jgi:hypothetical protein
MEKGGRLAIATKSESQESVPGISIIRASPAYRRLTILHRRVRCPTRSARTPNTKDAARRIVIHFLPAPYTAGIGDHKHRPVSMVLAQPVI